jgi:hypothetical protein
LDGRKTLIQSKFTGMGLRKKYPDASYKNGKVLESAELPLPAWSFFRSEAECFIDATDAEDFADATDDGQTKITI